MVISIIYGQDTVVIIAI